MFAEHGADVIKVETRAYPDFMRVIMGGEMTPSFASSSRSKRSFGVNLKRPEGLASSRSGSSRGRRRDREQLDRHDGRPRCLGYDELAERSNPRLVYVSSQLLGSRGTHAAWIGYGPSVQAYGGLTAPLVLRRRRPPVGRQLQPSRPARRPPVRARRASPVCSGARPPVTGAHCEVAQVETVVATLGDLLLAEALEPGIGRRRRQRRRARRTVGRVPVRRQRGLVRHLRA